VSGVIYIWREGERERGRGGEREGEGRERGRGGERERAREFDPPLNKVLLTKSQRRNASQIAVGNYPLYETAVTECTICCNI
jgi:hypothetical protein